MDKPLEFLKKYWGNNHYTDITENPEPDFNSNFFIAIRNLMSDFNIYANSDECDLKSDVPTFQPSKNIRGGTVHDYMYGAIDGTFYDGSMVDLHGLDEVGQSK